MQLCIVRYSSSHITLMILQIHIKSLNDLFKMVCFLFYFCQPDKLTVKSKVENAL